MKCQVYENTSLASYSINLCSLYHISSFKCIMRINGVASSLCEVMKNHTALLTRPANYSDTEFVDDGHVSRRNDNYNRSDTRSCPRVQFIFKMTVMFLWVGSNKRYVMALHYQLQVLQINTAATSRSWAYVRLLPHKWHVTQEWVVDKLLDQVTRKIWLFSICD